MELTNRFSLPVPPDQAWDLLMDFERMARAMPGATLTKAEGDHIEGQMLVKLGPMRISYEGEASIVERNQEEGRLLIEAAGKESRGSGTARVRIETHLDPDASGTVVTLHSTVNVTGRPAQMGLGLIQDVGQKLADEFARRLKEDLATRTAATGVTPANPRDPRLHDRLATAFDAGAGDVLDLGSAAAIPVLRRLALIVLAVVLGIGVILLAVWAVRR
ncbi:MAG: SRPBCC family protein [Acidimicrobiia bacterium]